MARSSKSLAGQAAAVARKLIGGGGRRGANEPVGESASSAVTAAAPVQKTAKKTVSKKTASKQTPAKKTAAKKTAAKKTVAKKTPANATKTAAKKTAAKKTAANATKTAAKKTPAKRPAARKATAKGAATPTPTPTKKVPVKKSSASAATKKAPASALVVKSDEKDWTHDELGELLGELHQQRDHSLAIIGDQETELSGLLRDSGDGAGHDQADVGATSFERDQELAVLSSEHDKLAQIDRALGRIDDGTYGQCESCGQPIGKMRLMAFPRATLCMPCKQREERR